MKHTSNFILNLKHEMFNIFYTFLQPGANALIYLGSVTNTDFTKEPSKYGRSRSLQPQEELFFTLVRLCCGLPIEDLSVRLNISTSTISRIVITWRDFLHSRLRALPIWSQRKTVNEFIPKAFKEFCPSTRCIIDCSEIFIEMPTSYRSSPTTKIIIQQYSKRVNRNCPKWICYVCV